jgi:hypothetical protein
MTNLRDWLEARGLERYAEALLAQDIELDILPKLTDSDLAAAGLPLGARKRLLQAIEGFQSGEQAIAPPAAPQTKPKAVPAPEAERRQLTVLFCDVVGSTSLAEKLDPEDLRSLLLTFQGVCADVVERHEGQIGLFIGVALPHILATQGLVKIRRSVQSKRHSISCQSCQGLKSKALKPAAVFTPARW